MVPLEQEPSLILRRSWLHHLLIEQLQLMVQHVANDCVLAGCISISPILNTGCETN